MLYSLTRVMHGVPVVVDRVVGVKVGRQSWEKVLLLFSIWYRTQRTI